MSHSERTIGVIGAGVMGRGVAIRFASNGFSVKLLDNNEKTLKKAEEDIYRQIKFMKMFQKNVDESEIKNNICFTLSYEDMSNVDYIVENVPEVLEIKRDVYAELNKICKKDCFYMVNTSCIPITKIGSYMNHPDKVIGVHFMNPVPMKNFSEVIRGYYTSEDTVKEIQSVLGEVGITIEVIQDSAGFVSNRLSHLFMNEAAYLVFEGVAKAEQIDNIFKQGFGHKMGPLETADLIGVDTVLDSLEILYQHYEDPKFRACPLLKQMVSAGITGRKNGKGFYNY